MNSMLSLPVALLLNLFQYLNLNDKKSLSLCCAYLQKITLSSIAMVGSKNREKTPEKRVKFPKIPVNSQVFSVTGVGPFRSEISIY